MLIYQDHVSFPQSPRVGMNLNAEKKTELIEENSFSSMASIKYVNMDSRTLVDLKKKIKEE